MSLPIKNYSTAKAVSRIAAVVMALAVIAVGGVQAAETSSRPRFAELAVGLPQASLKLLSLSRVIVNRQTVGAIAIYDDPTTQRLADYIEVLNSEGVVVVVSWFDSFGIERLVVDRALLEGGEELQGVFVAVVNGEVI